MKHIGYKNLILANQTPATKIATSKSGHKDSKLNDDFYFIKRVFIIQKMNTNQGNWYKDYYAFKCICNIK